MNNTRIGLAVAAGLGVALLVFFPVVILVEHRLTDWRQLLLFVPSIVVGGVAAFVLYRGLGDEVSSQVIRITKLVAVFGTTLLAIFLLFGISARIEAFPTIGATQALVISIVIGLSLAGLFYFRDSS